MVWNTVGSILITLRKATASARSLLIDLLPAVDVVPAELADFDDDVVAAAPAADPVFDDVFPPLLLISVLLSEEDFVTFITVNESEDLLASALAGKQIAKIWRIKFSANINIDKLSWKFIQKKIGKIVLLSVRPFISHFPVLGLS